MPPLQRAHVNAPILKWARERCHFTIEAAAKRIGVKPAALAAWEEGTNKPTVKQLRKVAHTYRYSLAVFFLAAPPGDAFKPIRDYRRFPGALGVEISAQLYLAIREAYDRRESSLELFELIEEQPPIFEFQAAITDDPERVGARLRSYLGIDAEEQRHWRRPEVALPQMRAKLEQHGVLVFQFSRIPKEEARGFAIGEFPLPAVVVNRGDAAAGRLFSLMHEVAHLSLRAAGVCNLVEEEAWHPGMSDVEPFCNQVAAATLVPSDLFLGHAKIRATRQAPWTIEDLEPLARDFAVSRYVIARRLLTFRIVPKQEYDELIEALDIYIAGLPKRQGGYLSPAQNVVSLAGNVFTGLVLEAFGRARISASTVASYFGVQLKHLPDVRQAIDRTL